MSAQRAFYETVRKKAAQRWDQLEQDPELAGPWHQLFKQVQSPRHILSELLQNADDAGATEASVRIEDQTFIFEHNGEDFTDEHFASLCRFGYSNKRALHTIGFRGIGFKSTFSLGDCVKLFTPSLSVCFHRRRFTEPHRLSDNMDTLGNTRVVVEISDRHRQREVEKNLEEWLKSPVSLLFFKSIRRMRIGDQETDPERAELSSGMLPAQISERVPARLDNHRRVVPVAVPGPVEGGNRVALDPEYRVRAAPDQIVEKLVGEVAPVEHHDVVRLQGVE
ncbi:MAG: ATP-binding protein, partial [Albidovulum sp.]|nr:ATP-binding protein [Albidovulum sp.]